MDAIIFKENTLSLLDQTRLPTEEAFVKYTDYRMVGRAIRDMVVRGAPAIGVAAAYAYYLAALEFSPLPAPDFRANMETAKSELAGARPTALNLFWALDRMESVLEEKDWEPAVCDRLLSEALEIHREDIYMNKNIGRFGAALVPQHARILTHCNAGALATGGYGTALGVIRAAYEQGKVDMVYADETRPLLQGARLTAYELVRDGIPTTLVTDNMAGHLMKNGMIDLIIVGADRVAANGDFANKIGTYSLAVLAKHHGIPMYTAMPYSTIDFSLPDGSGIVIEQRPLHEVTHLSGVQTAPEGVAAYNPAFDVTPNSLLSGIITDRGVVKAPFGKNLKKLYESQGGAD